MKYIIKPLFSIIIISIVHLLTSCEGFLDEKPSKSIVIPQTVEDLNALLRNTVTLNEGAILPLILADQFYLKDKEDLSMFSTYQQKAFLWREDMFLGEGNISDWAKEYEKIFYANVILEQADKILENEKTGTKKIEPILGSAYFIRAHALFNLLQLFAPVYNKSTSDDTPGVPIRLTADVQQTSSISSVSDCYNRVLSDLISAIDHLPKVSEAPTIPTVYAAHALLSRTYMSMGFYEEAGISAQKVLQSGKELMDYNSFNLNENYPFPKFNSEILYHFQTINSSFTYSKNLRVDSTLFKSYHDNDLRKRLYYKISSGGMVNFKGSYSGGYRIFTGITLDEIYLNIAESHIRGNRIGEGLTFLNNLLFTRWKNGTYTPLTSFDKEEALKIVLEERRKSLIARGLRWMDLKRLIRDGNWTEKLIRKFEDEQYMLEPLEEEYVLPIPTSETDIL